MCSHFGETHQTTGRRNIGSATNNTFEIAATAINGNKSQTTARWMRFDQAHLGDANLIEASAKSADGLYFEPCTRQSLSDLRGVSF